MSHRRKGMRELLTIKRLVRADAPVLHLLLLLAVLVGAPACRNDSENTGTAPVVSAAGAGSVPVGESQSPDPTPPATPTAIRTQTATPTVDKKSPTPDATPAPTEDPDGSRPGAVVLDAQAAVDNRLFLHGYSLDPAGGDTVDYYTFATDARYELGLGVRDQWADLDVILEDADGGTVMQTWPPPGDASIEWLKTVVEPGTYYIGVEAREQVRTPYYIRIGLKPMADTQADADRLMRKAHELAVAHIGVEQSRKDDVALLAWEGVYWSDSSLGCMQEGFGYAAAVVPGYRIWFSYEDEEIAGHVDEQREIMIVPEICVDTGGRSSWPRPDSALGTKTKDEEEPSGPSYGEARNTPPAPAPEPASAAGIPPDVAPGPDWVRVLVPGLPGDKGFTLMLPPNWEFRELQGVDSYVGEIVGDGVTLHLDYGWYGWDLDLETRPDPAHEYTESHEKIGGMEARILLSKDPSGGRTGVHIDEVGNPMDEILLLGCALTPEQQETAVAIFRSIRSGLEPPRRSQQGAGSAIWPSKLGPQGSPSMESAIQETRLVKPSLEGEQYVLRVTSGRSSSSCTRYGDYETRRANPFVIEVSVFHYYVGMPNARCTRDWITDRTAVPLGSDFAPGKEYTIIVNGDTSHSFVHSE